MHDGVKTADGVEATGDERQFEYDVGVGGVNVHTLCF